MIYLKLCGRIGNQIFMYAYARYLQEIRGNKEKIIIEDTANEKMQYENSLVYYDLPMVEYIHDMEKFNSKSMSRIRHMCTVLDILEKNKPYEKIWKIDKLFYPLFSRMGMLRLQDGYIREPKRMPKDIYLQGYFQSEKFFSPIKDEIKNTFRIEDMLRESGYPGIDKIDSRNTVCISIKVQHNAGNPMYDVCDMEYYKKAIEIITNKVDNPLFMICSDNVDYVKEKLIDCNQFECICQEKGYPVHIALAAMARCKHFIIGNTSFGWWAQYLSDNEGKIVIAPSRWYGIALPRDIYQDNWTLVEV